MMVTPLQRAPPVCTFELGDFQVFGLLQLLVAVSVFVQQPAVVLALHLVLLLQVVILLLQILVLVLVEKRRGHREEGCSAVRVAELKMCWDSFHPYL